MRPPLRWTLITHAFRAMKLYGSIGDYATSPDKRFPPQISAIVPASPWKNRLVPKHGVFLERVVILVGIAIEVRSFKPDNSRRSFPPV